MGPPSAVGYLQFLMDRLLKAYDVKVLKQFSIPREKAKGFFFWCFILF